MSDIAVAYLERWTEENVSAVPGPEQQDEAERLAAACLAAAVQEDISEVDLNEACAALADGADLISYFAAAIDRVAMEELDDLVASDEDED